MLPDPRSIGIRWDLFSAGGREAGNRLMFTAK